MLAIAEPHPRPKAERFYRPGTDVSFVRHFPALRAGLLLLSPSLLRPCRSSNRKCGLQATADKPRQVLTAQSQTLKLTCTGGCRIATKDAPALAPNR